MKKIIIGLLFYSYICMSFAEQIKLNSSLSVEQPYWKTEHFLNQQGTLHFSRASIKDYKQNMIFALDYQPENDCRLSQSTIFILSEEPQLNMLPISVFGKMQIDDQMVHTVEAQVTSKSGDKFISLIILRPDLDQVLFRGKDVNFHLKNYGFIHFSLNQYQTAIREAIPICEKTIKDKVNMNPM